MEGKDKAYFIRKAKRERGLSDEEIDYFLQRHLRWDLLPYYARFVRKFGPEEALNEVRQMFGDSDLQEKNKEQDMEQEKIIDVTGAELHPGKPDECQGNGKHPEFAICCDECDYFLQCFPEYDVKNKRVEK